MQIETTHHLNEPLVLQCLWYHDKNTLGTTRQHLLVDDHACFDGFTQTYFIREQYARRMTTTDFVRNVKLMRDQACAHTTQATHWTLVLFKLVLQRTVAKYEVVHAVDLTCVQLVLRLVKTNVVA